MFPHIPSHWILLYPLWFLHSCGRGFVLSGEYFMKEFTPFSMGANYYFIFSYFTHNFWRFFQESEIAEPFLSLPLKNMLSIRKTQNFIWVCFQIHTCKMHMSSFKKTEILSSFFSSNESVFFFIISFWRFPLFPWFRWCFLL